MTISAEELWVLFCDRIFCYHSQLETIVSDRGLQFASCFWKHLGSCLNLRLSTAFQPQTDGETEHRNAVVEQNLQAYVNYLQDNWVE